MMVGVDEKLDEKEKLIEGLLNDSLDKTVKLKQLEQLLNRLETQRIAVLERDNMKLKSQIRDQLESIRSLEQIVIALDKIIRTRRTS